MSRQKKFRKAVEESSAAELGSNAIEQVREAIVPLLATAGEKAQTAAKKAAPLAEQAKGRLQPQVDAARGMVQDDLVPKLVEMMHQAETHPAVAEASSRGKSTVAALKGEIVVPEPKKRHVGRTLVKLAAVSAMMAAAAVAVRQFLGSKDDEWTAHQPSQAYVNRPDEDEQSTPAMAEPTVQQDVEVEAEPEAVMADEGGQPAEETSEDLGALNTYGEGSYVGDEPPAEFTIKGNERSMKYHTSDSAGYERTIADVWFSSSEAAEKAGFSQAQR